MASDYVNLGQIAERLHVPYNTVYRWWWRSTKDRRAIGIPMPPPVMRIGVKDMAVWEWEDIQNWHEQWKAAYEERMKNRSQEWKEKYGKGGDDGDA